MRDVVIFVPIDISGGRNLLPRDRGVAGLEVVRQAGEQVAFGKRLPPFVRQRDACEQRDRLASAVDLKLNLNSGSRILPADEA